MRLEAGRTFLALLHDRGRRGGYLHGQAVRPAERVAVPHDEGARLLVLQHGDGYVPSTEDQKELVRMTRKSTFPTRVKATQTRTC